MIYVQYSKKEVTLRVLNLVNFKLLFKRYNRLHHKIRPLPPGSSVISVLYPFFTFFCPIGCKKRFSYMLEFSRAKEDGKNPL